MRRPACEVRARWAAHSRAPLHARCAVARARRVWCAARRARAFSPGLRALQGSRPGGAPAWRPDHCRRNGRRCRSRSRCHALRRQRGRGSGRSHWRRRWWRGERGCGRRGGRRSGSSARQHHAPGRCAALHHPPGDSRRQSRHHQPGACQQGQPRRCSAPLGRVGARHRDGRSVQAGHIATAPLGICAPQRIEDVRHFFSLRCAGAARSHRSRG